MPSLLTTTFFPSDLQVLEFDTFRDITIVNPSGQPVLMRWLLVRSAIPNQPHQWSIRWDINQSVEPSKPLTVNLVELAKNQFRGREKEWYGSQQGNYVQHLKEKDKQEIFQHKRYKTFLKRDGTEHRQVVEDIGKYTTTFTCLAEVSYLFLHSHSERKSTPDCVGFLKHLAPADKAIIH